MCFKLINFFFEIIPVFVPENFTDFTSYIVQIISTCLASILQLLEFSPFSLVQ